MQITCDNVETNEYTCFLLTDSKDVNPDSVEFLLRKRLKILKNIDNNQRIIVFPNENSTQTHWKYKVLPSVKSESLWLKYFCCVKCINYVSTCVL